MHRLPLAFQAKLPDSSEFIIQLIAAQRSIDSIIGDFSENKRLPESAVRNFTEQRSDFSIESPYYRENKPKGIVIEIDGSHHVQDSQRYLDTQRDKAVAESDWFNTLRITTSDFHSSALNEKINNIFLPVISNQYVKNCLLNFKDSLLDNGWKQEILEICLIPFAIARIQRAFVEGIANKSIFIDKKKIKVAILERDVPCGSLAFEDLDRLVDALKTISKTTLAWPEIELKVFNTSEFAQSRFQKVYCKQISEFNAQEKFDLVIDVAVLERNQNPPLPAANASEIICIRSAHYIDSHRKVHTNDLLKYRSFCKRDGNTDKWEITDKKIQSSLQYFLQSVFRKKEFRDGQLPILNSALQ